MNEEKEDGRDEFFDYAPATEVRKCCTCYGSQANPNQSCNSPILDQLAAASDQFEGNDLIREWDTYLMTH